MKYVLEFHFTPSELELIFSHCRANQLFDANVQYKLPYEYKNFGFEVMGIMFNLTSHINRYEDSGLSTSMEFMKPRNIE